MNVLIIGANGFLGNNVAKKCIEKGWMVTCSYNKNKNNIPKTVRLVSIHKALNDKEKFDTVFLVAAFIPKSHDENSKQLFESNVELPFQVHQAFPTATIVFSSSVSVYGTPEKILNENSPFNNPNKYGLSKLAAEYIIQSHSSYRILRFSSLYGKRMNQSTFLPAILDQAIKHKSITLLGEGKRRQDYLYIDDAANYCIAAALSKHSGIYLGVNGKSYTNSQVAEIVAKNDRGCNILYTGVDKSPSFIYDNSHSLKALKFKPHYSLEKGILKVI